MKSLELVCSCGQTKTVSGQNTQEIITTIDAIGWIDEAWDKARGRELAQGQIPAQCPECAASS